MRLLPKARFDYDPEKSTAGKNILKNLERSGWIVAVIYTHRA